jgi:hypothetical protein
MIYIKIGLKVPSKTKKKVKNGIGSWFEIKNYTTLVHTCLELTMAKDMSY